MLICKELILEIWNKFTIRSIPWIYSEHAHLLCSFTPENCWIFPLWSCLSPWLLMMRRQLMLICKELMLEIWKKLTITSIPWIYSEHAHLLCSFTPKIGKFPSLKLFISMIIDDVETVGMICRELILEIWNKFTIRSIPWIDSEHAHLRCSFTQEIGKSPYSKLFISVIINDAETVGIDLRRAIVGDMKKNYNRVNPMNRQWACSLSLQLYARNWQISLFEVIYLRDYWWCGNSWCWFAKS